MCVMLSGPPRCARRTTHHVLFAAAALLSLLGCQHNTQARWAAERRAIRPGRTFDTYLAGEAARGPKLARTFDLMDRRVETDTERTAMAPADVRGWLERDTERFRGRVPIYGRRLVETFSGHPERIEQSAIVLFY